jgi:NADPH:quinone reductase-like Zn-dependent oxidoreductase
MTLEHLIKTLQVIAQNDPKTLALPVYLGHEVAGRVGAEAPAVCDRESGSGVAVLPRKSGYPKRLTIYSTEEIG